MLDNGWFAFKRYGTLTDIAGVFAASFAGQYLYAGRRIADDAFTGETIPIRLFLGGFDLTPTFREVNKKYSTRYYLSLVLIDEGAYSHYVLLYQCYLPALSMHVQFLNPQCCSCISRCRVLSLLLFGP